MRRLVAIAATVACLSGCAAFKDTVRTITDVAFHACKLSEHARFEADQAGIDVEELCRRAEVLRPFLDELLSAQLRAGARAGLVVDVPGAE